MHGTATITQSNVMSHLALTTKVEAGAANLLFQIIAAAMEARSAPGS